MIQINNDQSAALTAHAKALGWLTADQHITALSVAGEGNMNKVLRARLDDGSTLIFKQSVDHVAKYPNIPAPIERLDVEAAFYREIARDAVLRERTPSIVGYDPEHHLLCMHDLGEASDFVDWYQDNGSRDHQAFVITALLNWLSHLHQLPIPQAQQPRFNNSDMRALNHEHIFAVPLAPDNGLSFEPPLAEYAKCLRQDADVLNASRELGDLYLGKGTPTTNHCLLHGDFYPGSWVRHPHQSVMVIDPEFSFVGPAEFDVGVMLAHLTFAGIAPSLISKQMSAYQSYPQFSFRLATRFAGIEIIRRLLGVAQLPLRASVAEKLTWLQTARQWLLSGDQVSPRNKSAN